ncbi:hypothetical protein CBL_04118 [Carabus blaptoides fortunei]
MIHKIILVYLFVIYVLTYNTEAKVLAPEDIRDLDDIRVPGGSKRPCPLCDSSVYVLMILCHINVNMQTAVFYMLTRAMNID